MQRQTCWLVLAFVLVLPRSAFACPLCADAIANSADQEEADNASNFPAAMNQSIYLMVSVPYVTLAVVGLLIYRGCKKNAQYLSALERTPGPVPPAEA